MQQKPKFRNFVYIQMQKGPLELDEVHYHYFFVFVKFFCVMQLKKTSLGLLNPRPCVSPTFSPTRQAHSGIWCFFTWFFFVNSFVMLNPGHKPIPPTTLPPPSPRVRKFFDDDVTTQCNADLAPHVSKKCVPYEEPSYFYTFKKETINIETLAKFIHAFLDSDFSNFRAIIDGAFLHLALNDVTYSSRKYYFKLYFEPGVLYKKFLSCPSRL
jgi:hypothetical protein